MVILLKIKRRDFFFNETAFLFWCQALWKLLSSNCWNETHYGTGNLYKDLLFVYLHPSVNKNLQNLAILTLQFDDVITSVTFRVKNVVSFCVKKLLHFALKSCHILRQKLLHFGLMLHFASKVVLFRVNVTFSVNCYILRRNRDVKNHLSLRKGSIYFLWLWTTTNTDQIKNNGTVVYVGSSLQMQNPLFLVGKLWRNK